MGESGQKKICALCGADCSKKRRAKDTEGRYYCLSCFEERLEKVRRKRHRERGDASDDPKDTSGTMMGTFGIDQELVADEVARVEPADDAPKALCPACGFAVEASAVLCVHCGHDFEAGRQLRMQKKVISRERPAIWPTVLGLFCVLFCAAGLFVYGGQLVRLILLAFSEESASIALMTGAITGAVIMVVLTVMQGFGGVFVWMRFGTGVRVLHSWAWAKLAVMTVAAAAGLLAIYAFPGVVSELSLVQEAKMRLAEVLPDDLTRALLGLWVWQCAWPILLLLWFRGEQVRKDIVEWDAPLEPSTALYEENVAN